MINTRYTTRNIFPDQTGFSLVEIMIVILLVGVLATVSTPPIYNYVQSNRLQTTTDRMVADMNYARSISIASGQILRFTVTEDGYTLTNPVTGDELKNVNFEHGVELDADQRADFFPWGMADQTVFEMTNRAGMRRITLLPTGIAESVHGS